MLTYASISHELYNLIVGYREKLLYWQVLYPWSKSVNAALLTDWLIEFGTREGFPIPAASDRELNELYLLSRVNQVLMLRFQHGRADGTDWRGPNIRIDEYLDFMQELGFDLVESIEFSPFFHEIVEVIPAKQPQAEIEVDEIFWPGLMLGDLMFSRSGVRVVGGNAKINPAAASSTLYWAYRRKYRSCRERYDDWGYFSQLAASSFRRDYKIGQRLYYNVDARNDLASSSCEADRNAEQISGVELELLERIELLKHRCFITVTKPDRHLYPYYDRYQEAFSPNV